MIELERTRAQFQPDRQLSLRVLDVRFPTSRQLDGSSESHAVLTGDIAAGEP